MYETNYHKAKDARQAVKLISDCDDGKFLAGGQTLIPTMKQRLAEPTDLIDISKVKDMGDISVDEESVTIGAITIHADVASNEALAETCPGLSQLAGMIGDPHVRNKGTIGGSIANNDPAADYPAAMMALNAKIKTNQRVIDCDNYFLGMFETALEDGEIIKSVSFKIPRKSSYAKFPNPASRYAMAGVFVTQDEMGKARVGITGAGADGVFRHREMEKALTKNFSSAALSGIDINADEMLSDIHGDGAYRASLVSVMAKRAVDKA